MSESTPSAPDLSIVVPVYNSQDCLVELHTRLASVLDNKLTFQLILVDDGSVDDSWQVIKRLSQQDKRVKGVRLRKNFGQDNALLAGISNASGQFLIIMDDDLQHDPADIPHLHQAIITRHLDVVFARFEEKKQAWWKNMGSWFNGKVAEWIIQKPPGLYLSPFKIIRGDLVQIIKSFDGPYLYLDGLIFQVTNRVGETPAIHHHRFAGESTYSLKKSIAVWLNNAISFSPLPMRLVTFIGLATAAFSMLTVFAVILYRLLAPASEFSNAEGWASLIATIMFMGGVQLCSLGVSGEYIGRIYSTLMRKPQFTIHEITNQD